MGRGRSLEELCLAAEAEGARVPVALLLRVLVDACAGLHAAHDLTADDGTPLHVVHRDVTPSNLLVSTKGFAKVIDFGIAKARDRVSGETRSGFVKGTPQYMAPEAACKMPLDRRADVWSLGAVLYRALTGKPPFPDHHALLEYIDGLARLPALPDHVPPDVKAIFERALQIHPSKRFATAEEMRHALERALHAGGASADEISAAASRLASTARAVPTTSPTALAATELALPGERLYARRRDANAGSTLVSPTSDVRERARGAARGLALAVVAAAIVTVGALAFAFCG